MYVKQYFDLIHTLILAVRLVRAAILLEIVFQLLTIPTRCHGQQAGTVSLCTTCGVEQLQHLWLLASRLAKGKLHLLTTCVDL